jgi:hypothetical protein
LPPKLPPTPLVRPESGGGGMTSHWSLQWWSQFYALLRSRIIWLRLRLRGWLFGFFLTCQNFQSYEKLKKVSCFLKIYMYSVQYIIQYSTYIADFLRLIVAPAPKKLEHSSYSLPVKCWTLLLMFSICWN